MIYPVLGSVLGIVLGICSNYLIFSIFNIVNDVVLFIYYPIAFYFHIGRIKAIGPYEI